MPRGAWRDDDEVFMKTYTVDELNDILKKHKSWLCGVADGSRADLRGANLRGANLRGAYLEGANLGGANLEGARRWKKEVSSD